MGNYEFSDFSNFNSNTSRLEYVLANEHKLHSLGIDLSAPDTVFGTAFVYCSPHRSAHTAGTCNVPISRKCPLKATNYTEACTEVRNRFGY